MSPMRISGVSQAAESLGSVRCPARGRFSGDAGGSEGRIHCDDTRQNHGLLFECF